MYAMVAALYPLVEVCKAMRNARHHFVTCAAAAVIFLCTNAISRTVFSRFSAARSNKCGMKQPFSLHTACIFSFVLVSSLLWSL